jgi:hypothetical protein
MFSDDVKSKFAKLGKGYENWITAAIVALEMKDGILRPSTMRPTKMVIKSRISLQGTSILNMTRRNWGLLCRDLLALLPQLTLIISRSRQN